MCPATCSRGKKWLLKSRCRTFPGVPIHPHCVSNRGRPSVAAPAWKHNVEQSKTHRFEVKTRLTILIGM